jgi:hypothetical protein
MNAPSSGLEFIDADEGEASKPKKHVKRREEKEGKY